MMEKINNCVKELNEFLSEHPEFAVKKIKYPCSIVENRFYTNIELIKDDKFAKRIIVEKLKQNFKNMCDELCENFCDGQKDCNDCPLCSMTFIEDLDELWKEDES